MSFLYGILLGFVQGLTEFLPISSSGHLVLIQHLIKFRGQALALDSLLHLGTLVAVIVYFRKEIAVLLRSLWRWAWRRKKDEYTIVAAYLLIATIPAGVIGFVLNDFFTGAFSSVAIVGPMLVVTGMILWFGEVHRQGKVSLEHMTLGDSLWVGLAQAMAIMPGISRSGSTIAAGMWRGMAHEDAAKFSFLLSIPTIIGASLFELLKMDPAKINISMAAAGMLAAAFSGFAAIALLMKLIREQKLRLFSVYCFIIGGIAIAASLAGWR